MNIAPGDPVVCSWSSGKDSAYSLEQAFTSGLNVVGLLCTVNTDADRVAMHAVRRELLAAQAERLRLPMTYVEIPAGCSHELYASRMRVAIARAANAGVKGMIFGDLFLEDVRQYRVDMLQGTGIEPISPLWRRETEELAHEMIDAGMRAIVTCVDLKQASSSLAGRPFDREFVSELPPSVDPCGENGEFHTFVWDAPSFRSPIPVRVGEKVERDGFAFRDVLSGP